MTTATIPTRRKPADKLTFRVQRGAVLKFGLPTSKPRSGWRWHWPDFLQRDMEVRTTTGLERAKLPGPGCQKEPYSPGRLSPALFLTF
jgi:hypothetical protein